MTVFRQTLSPGPIDQRTCHSPAPLYHALYMPNNFRKVLLLILKPECPLFQVKILKSFGPLRKYSRQSGGKGHSKTAWFSSLPVPESTRTESNTVRACQKEQQTAPTPHRQMPTDENCWPFPPQGAMVPCASAHLRYILCQGFEAFVKLTAR